MFACRCPSESHKGKGSSVAKTGSALRRWSSNQPVEVREMTVVSLVLDI